MILHFEGVRARGAPAAHLDVATFVVARGHTVLRQVGHRQEHGLQLGLEDLQAIGAGLEFVTDTGHLGHDGVDFGSGVFALGGLAFEHADLFGQAVALGLQLLGAGLDGLALALEGAETLHVQEGLGVLALGQAGQDGVEVLAQQSDVEHVGVRFSRGGFG